MFLTTSVLGLNWNSMILKKSEPLVRLLDCKTSADIPRVLASAGVSLEATWFNSSTLALVCYKISNTRFVINIGLLVE